jgi:hypothetical protein
MGSPSAGAWWQEHVAHTLIVTRVKGYSPVWGEGEGFELWCTTCGCLLDEFASCVDEEDEFAPFVDEESV